MDCPGWPLLLDLPSCTAHFGSTVAGVPARHSNGWPGASDLGAILGRHAHSHSLRLNEPPTSTPCQDRRAEPRPDPPRQAGPHQATAHLAPAAAPKAVRRRLAVRPVSWRHAEPRHPVTVRPHPSSRERGARARARGPPSSAGARPQHLGLDRDGWIRLGLRPAPDRRAHLPSGLLGQGLDAGSGISRSLSSYNEGRIDEAPIGDIGEKGRPTVRRKGVLR
jgi:hypothetical protein